MKYKLFVEGHPTTAGSLKWYGKGQVVHANARTLKWEQWIAWTWLQAHERTLKVLGPVEIWLTFVFKRPKSHFTSKGEIRKPFKHMTAPCWHRRLDLDKLTRAVFDALTGCAYEDDGQITDLHARKVWGETEGVDIIVEGEI